MMQNCIFCKIISGSIHSEKFYENDDVIVIKDIAPKASIHYLIIPKKHIANIQSCESQDTLLLGKLLMTAQTIATMLPNNPEFKLVSNNGASVGQSVFHIHIHFLAGGGPYLQQSAV
ncbi:HIT domain-containing protein [Candidatus Babeliales bacterium]|nr:HIT domain-containing protein [Candidatus Babeliales bacterium]